MKKLFKKYWFVGLVGMFFISTNLYNQLGDINSVFWCCFHKTTKDLFIILLSIVALPALHNTISMLCSLGVAAYFSGLVLFRLFCAFKSIGVYEKYFDYLGDAELSLLFSVFSFVVYFIIYYITNKE